jgi:hypothetical protein
MMITRRIIVLVAQKGFRYAHLSSLLADLVRVETLANSGTTVLSANESGTIHRDALTINRDVSYTTIE